MRYIISQKEQQLGNVRIPKNAIILIDGEEYVMCKDFPRNYKGTNPMLTIWYYDEIHEVWECDLWQNKYTQILWKIYVQGGCKKLPRLVRPQVQSIYNKVPHNTKIGNVQSPCMCDPEKKRLNETTIGYHDFVRPRQSSNYHYYSYIGAYGKAGANMSL